MAQRGLKRSALVFSTRAFTLLEMLLVVFIVALLIAGAVPTLRQLMPRSQRQEFLAQLNVMVNRAWQEALATHKKHRIRFELEQRRMLLEQETGRDDKNKAVYSQVIDQFLETAYTWPESLQIKDFFIEGRDMVHVPGVRIHEIWFFVFPDGLAQDVIINMFDTQDTRESEAGSRFALSLSPFTTRFNIHEAFIKP